MILTNPKTVDAYGQLFAHDENNDAWRWLGSGLGMLPGEGLMILEIQERIKRVLHQTLAMTPLSSILQLAYQG